MSKIYDITSFDNKYNENHERFFSIELAIKFLLTEVYKDTAKKINIRVRKDKGDRSSK